MFKRNFLDFIYLGLLFGFILVFFGKLFFPSPLKIFVTPDFGTSDLLHFYYPIKDLLSSSLKKFDVPLWSSNVGGGFPMHAEGQMGVFNVFNLIFFGLLPTTLAFNLTYVFSFFTVAISTYILARLFKFTASVSLLSASIFTFSGFYISHISHPSLLQSASLLPVEVIFVEFFLRKKRWIFLLLFSFTISQQFLTGLQQVTLYSLTFVVFYALFRLLMERKKDGGKLLFVQVVIIGLSIIFSLFLAAIQILPSYELANFSIREGGLPLREIFAFPYVPKHLLTFFSPFYLGNPASGSYLRETVSGGIFWENTGYVGVLTLILAFVAIVGLARKNKLVLFFSLTLLTSILLVLGKDSPLYIIFTIPPFNLFRVPSRFLLISDFSLAILAGFGAMFLSNLKTIKKWRYRSILPILFSLIIIGDIFFFFYNYHPVGDAKIWTGATKTVESLKQDKSLYRIYTLGSYIPWNEVFLKDGWKNTKDYLNFLEDLNADFNLLFDISSANIHVTIPTRRLALMQSLVGKGVNVDSDARSISIDKKTKDLLSLVNIKYILTPLSIKGDGFKLVFEDRSQSPYSYKIYENTGVLERVFVVTRSKTAKSVEELSRFILSEDFDPAKTIILEKEIAHSAKDSSYKEVRVLYYQDTKVKIQTSADSDGFLVLADSYYPGWKVYVDEKEKEVLAANVNQRAVYLEKGEHDIVYSYEPKSVRIGGIISLTTHILLILLVFLSLKFKTPLKG